MTENECRELVVVVQPMRLQRQPISRGGMTVIELLVAISVIAVLTALLTPAVLNARSASQRVECQNRMRNVALGMQGFAEANRRYPATALYSTGAGNDLQGNWVVQLLPFLDQDNVFKKWDFKKPASDPVNQVAGKMPLPVLACPSDITARAGDANLSYVANAGIGWTEPIDCPVCLHSTATPAFQPLDLNGNGVFCPAAGVADGAPTDRDIFKMMGLFFVENWPVGSGSTRHQRLEHILDGTSQTLCFAENVRAGFDPATGDTWSSANPRRICFFLSGHVCTGASCSPGNVDYSRANNRGDPAFKLEAINSGLNQAEGEAPWPSSYHAHGVNVAFCDGHVKFLSETVDGRVYACLITPQGSRLTGPLAQPVVSDGDY